MGSHLVFNSNDSRLNAEEYVELYSTAYPDKLKPEADRLRFVLSRTRNVTLRLDNELVGCVRLLSDGCFGTFVLECTVHPRYYPIGLWARLFAHAGAICTTIAFSAVQEAPPALLAALGWRRGIQSFERDAPHGEVRPTSFQALEGNDDNLEMCDDDTAFSVREYYSLCQRLPSASFDSHAERALSRSQNVTARLDGRVVGCVRLLSDGYFATFVLDYAIDPALAHTDLLCALLARATALCRTAAFSPVREIPSSLRALGWEPGTYAYVLSVEQIRLLRKQLSGVSRKD